MVTIISVMNMCLCKTREMNAVKIYTKNLMAVTYWHGRFLL